MINRKIIYETKYIMRSIQRNTFRSISFLSVVFVLMSTLCFLQISVVRQKREISNSYDNMVVRVSVSNLNGVSDHLYLTTNYIDTFINEAYGLSKYFKQVSLKRSMYLLNEEVYTLFANEVNASNEKARLIGISTIDADPSLSEIAGTSIQFINGYDESALQSSKPVCLVNERLYDSLDENKDFIIIKAKSMDHLFAKQEPQPVETKMKIVGVIHGGKPYNIYCSFDMASQLGNQSDGSDPYTENMSAIIKDNKEISEFKEKAKRYYTKVDISVGASEYSFALTVHDRQLIDSISAFNKNLHLTQLAAKIILFLAAGVGFFVCFLSSKNRNVEFVLLRSLGLSKIRVIRLALLEHLILCVLAYAFSSLFVIVSTKNGTGLIYSAIFQVLLMFGDLISINRILMTDRLMNIEIE